MMWPTLRTELAYLRPWLLGGLGLGAAVVVIVSLVFLAVGDKGPPIHAAAGIRGMFMIMAPMIVGFIGQGFRSEERRERLLVAGPLRPRQRAAVTVLLPVVLAGIGILAAAITMSVEALITGQFSSESVNIVGYAGGNIFLGLMIGLLVQEASAAYREGRGRAAAGGWLSLGGAALLVAAFTTVAAIFQGPLSWPGIHLGNLLGAGLVMLAVVTLYSGRTDFTR